MFRRISLMLLMVVFLAGCAEEKVTDLEPNTLDSIVDESWYRSTEVCGETIRFSSDGTFVYYEDCGSPVEDYDCYEEYSYNEKTGIITIYEFEGNGKRKIEIVSCENDTLVLDFNGEHRTFEKQEERGNDVIEPISLEHDITYTEYDVTGDGENDEIQIVCTELVEEYVDAKYGTTWDILLNGQTKMTIESDMMATLEVDLYHVSDKRNYLFIKQNIDSNDDIIGATLYRFTEDSIVEEFDFYDMLLENINEFHSQIDISFMTAEYLTMSCSNQFNATARMNWEMNYEYEKAQESWVECDANYLLMYDESLEYKATGMTANQDFFVYEDWTCAEEAFTVKKGEVVQLMEIRFYNGKTYFHVEDAEGRQGWFADPDSAGTQIGDEWIYGYFEEAMFAG